MEALLTRLVAEGRKIVLFSEWTTMLDLIENRLRAHGMRWVRLDGSVAQRKRQQIVAEFQRDPKCRLFLTTNAGSTGLNLQAADTVVNVDLPWNPALLDQRIGRAHRMGQKRPVHAFVLVTTGTIEESLLATLAAKRELALAALDPNSDIDRVDLTGSMDDLKRRLELLLGAKPEAQVDEASQKAGEARIPADRKQRIAEAGGQLIAAAVRLLGELVPSGDETSASTSLVRDQLAGVFDTDATGRPVLALTLPDRATLDGIARIVGGLLARGPAPDSLVN